MTVADAAASDEAVLTIRGVEKRFGPTIALRGVDLEVRKGEVHALLGHNGSGKSTLIKILAGVFRADCGSASVASETLALGDARAAHAAGLRFVHQDRAIIGALNAVDNLALNGGFPKRNVGLIAWREARDRARRLFEELGYEIDIDVPAEEMTPAMQTSLAIARALQDGEQTPRVLILDEPTSAMTSADVARLLVVVERLRMRGLGVIFITHHLAEAKQIADRLTILRNGAVVADRPTAGMTEKEIVEIMLGREYVVDERASAARARSGRQSALLSQDSVASSLRPPMLKVSGLTTAVLRGIDMSAEQGEVVGVAGLAGSGAEELLQAIAGARPRGGVVMVDGRELEPSKPHCAVALGVGYVPSD